MENKSEKKRVLIVDDDYFMTRVLKMKFEQGGFEVLCANDGLEGLEKYKEAHPQVVITDVQMPRLDGWGLCTCISEYDEAQPELLIVITSRIEREQRNKITHFKNGHFADKPISPRKILQLVEDHLSH